MEERKNQYAIIRNNDQVLIALEEDFEIARNIAIENKSPMYLMDYHFDKKKIGQKILNGSCRWKFELEDLLD